MQAVLDHVLLAVHIHLVADVQGIDNLFRCRLSFKKSGCIICNLFRIRLVK